MTKILNFGLRIKGVGGWHMRSPSTLPPPKKNLKCAQALARFSSGDNARFANMQNY